MKPRQRVELQPAFLLHSRPYRETSAIAEFLTPEHGRVALVMRGGRGRGSRRCLDVFAPLLVSWSARGELGTLTRLEPARAPLRLGHMEVYSGYYANELLLRLLHKGEAVPGVYQAYERLLSGLAEASCGSRPLRLFEKRLLESLGYGADLGREWSSGRVLEPHGRYRIRPEQGPEPAGTSAGSDVFPGTSLLSLSSEALDDAASLRDARRILRIALDHYLGDRPLRSRQVMREVFAGLRGRGAGRRPAKA